MKPYYDDGQCVIYHGDCRDVLPLITFDLLVCDPPWGIDFNPSTGRCVKARGRSRKHTSAGSGHQRITGDAEPFNPSHLLSHPCVIWGANHFIERIPGGGAWLIWDKACQNDSPFRMAEYEMAWSNCVKTPRIFRHLWAGVFRASENISCGGAYLHPTQKPVALMEWSIKHSRVTGVVADPYMGSGPTLVAAKRMNRRAIGIEIEERYCEIAARRLQQGVLFVAGDDSPTSGEVQGAMFSD